MCDTYHRLATFNSLLTYIATQNLFSFVKIKGVDAP